MAIQKFAVILMDIRDFLFQSSIIRAKADIHFGIQVGVSMQGYSTKMQ